MKYFSILLTLVAMLATTGITKAQNASGPAGKTYTFVMKDGNGLGDEYFDKLSFIGSAPSSETYSAKGYQSSNYKVKAVGKGTGFEFTMNGPEGERKYDGVVEGDYIMGSILITDKDGNQSTWYFRGATNQAWNEMTKDVQVSE